MSSFVSTRAAAGVQPYYRNTNEYCCAFGSYTFDATFAGATTVEFCKLPKNCTIMGGKVYGEIIDTNGSPTCTMTLGDGTTAAKYMTSLALSGTAKDQDLTTTLLAAGPQDETDAVTVTGTFTAPGTFQAGTVTVTIFYVTN